MQPNPRFLDRPAATAPGTPQPVANKLLGLEALRFVAALGVLIWHYQHFADVADVPVGLVRNQLPFYRLLLPLYEAGEYGVWIFWCVSGFIFFWKYRDTIADRAMPGWTFFVFRLSRLYPLHAVTLVVVAILQAAYFRMQGYAFVYQDNDLSDFLLQIFMASKWGFEHGDSFNGPIWSISVEVLVYILFFLALRFVTKSAFLNLVIIVLCLNVSGQVFSCLAFFYAGGLAAIARRAMPNAAFGGWIEFGSRCAAAFIPVAIWMLSARVHVIGWMVLLGYTPALLFCLSCHISLPAPTQRLLTAAGNMTYSSYLLHFPVQLAIALGFALWGRPVPFHENWFFVAYVAPTLLMSYLTYRYFESPAQAWLRRRLLRSGAGVRAGTTVVLEFTHSPGAPRA